MVAIFENTRAPINRDIIPLKITRKALNKTSYVKDPSKPNFFELLEALDEFSLA